MATMTSEPIRTAPYVTATTLLMRLAHKLFTRAMTAEAIADPQDAAYNAWWTVRQTVEHFNEDRSLRLVDRQRTELDAALYIAHKVAHPHTVMPPLWMDCDCETAGTIVALHQLLAGQPARRRR